MTLAPAGALPLLLLLLLLVCDALRLPGLSSHCCWCRQGTPDTVGLPRLSELLDVTEDVLPDVPLITEHAWACAIPDVPMHHHM